MIHKAIFLLSLLSLLFCTNLRAENQFSNLSLSEGLSSRTVMAACKDQDGYLWFATKTGLDRYNGEVFTHYNLPQRHYENNRVKDLLIDKRGNVFAYSERRVYTYNRALDQFNQLQNIQLKPKGKINNLFFHSDNQLYVATNQGLFKKENSSLVLVEGTEHLHIFTTCKGYANSEWLYTSKGIYQLKQGKLQNFSSALKKIKNAKEVITMYYDEQTQLLWVGTFSQGLYIYDTEMLRMINHIQEGMLFPIRAITKAPDGSVWIGCDGKGILSYNPDGKKILTHFAENKKGKNKLYSDGIYDIFNDGHTLWVSTFTAGVMKYHPSKLVKKVYRHEEDNHATVLDDFINIVKEDSKGNLWIGTNRGLSCKVAKDGEWRHYYRHEDGSHNVVLTIHEDNLGNIWAGGYGIPLICIQQNNTIKKVSLGENDKEYIYHISEDHFGNLWMGSNNRGLICYTPKNQSHVSFPIKNIHDILHFDEQTLYLATSRGLYEFNTETSKSKLINLNTYIKQTKIERSYPIIYHVKQDPLYRDKLWLATDDQGLISYDTKAQRVNQFTTNHGLSSNQLSAICFDHLGNMWVSSTYGLNRFDSTRQRITPYYRYDGLPSEILNYRASSVKMNGNILLGTPNGAIEIDPSEDKNPIGREFNLRLEKFNLFYDEVVAKKENSVLSKVVDLTNKITLEYNQHSFSFDFINVNCTESNDYRYSWKLDGWEKEWSTPTQEHRAVYTNIPPGEYIFKVKVFKSDRIEENQIRKIAVIIQPPFWATIWAYIIYFILAVLIIYLIIRSYLKWYEARDSDQKIRFFVNIAHDIRTPLTLIKAPLQEIEQEELSEYGKDAVCLAQRNVEKLLGIVNQLLDFQKMERRSMTLRVEKMDIHVFLQEMLANYHLAIQEKKIRLNTHIDISIPPAFIDRHKLTVILDNLLSNAIKYTSNHGNIDIRSTYQQGNLIIEITDDGIGISKNAQSKLFKRFYRADNAINSTQTGSGIGLLLVKKMVKLHKGAISFSSLEGMGTRFRVEIPILESNYLPSEIIESKREYTTEIKTKDEDLEKKMTLLLVEDNKELRDYLSTFLSRKYRIFQANDGLEALDLIKSQTVDFIISDVVMPKMNGIALCNKLKSDIHTCHIPIILLSALTEREEMIKGLNSGADDYLTKPFDISILSSKIDAFVQNRRRFRKKYIDKSAFKEHERFINDLDKKFMNRVIEYIEENITQEDFSVDTIAMEMAMSHSVFYKKIKSLTEQTPKDLIKEIKMKKASLLLSEQKYTIGEVAYLTGYPNAKYFSTAFKKYFGCTPSQYIEERVQEMTEKLD